MLKERIAEEMKKALKAGEALRLSTLRMLFAALRQSEIDGRKTLSDSETEALAIKMIKQRRDAGKIYHDAGRTDLAAKEEAEALILQEFLPEQLDAAELSAAVAAAIKETGAEKPADMGRVMNLLKSRLAGRADFAAVSQQVKTALK